MSKSRDPEAYRLAQISSIAASEPVGSPLFVAHVGLLLFGAVTAILLFDVWWLAGVVLVYVSLFTLEKYVSARADARADAAGYRRILLLLFCRALTYNALVVAVWSIDGDIFKLAALALLVAAHINIMVFHATYPAVIACVVVPIWLGFGTLAIFFYNQTGLSKDAVAAVLILLCVSPYFFLALRSATDRYVELASTRQALSRSQKHEVIGSLVAGVAHDFNNILAVTQGNAELIKDTPSKQERDQFADEIMKAAARGASLSGQLLAFAGRANLAPARQDVRDVFRDLEGMVSRVFPTTIALSIHAPAAGLAVFVDRQQLDVALLNLAINARDAMPDGGQLVIDADSVDMSRQDSARMGEDLVPGSYIVISVTDTGVGMDKELQEEVFDPFFTTKSVGKGAGLGLSMVLGFARQSGGTVTIDSAVGRGTSLRLVLPAALGEATSRSQDPVRPVEDVRASVLVVEDDPSVRQIMENQLRAVGHRVSVAASGEEAAAMLDGGIRPDVIVADNVMPGTIQGVDLARIAANLSPGIPTIVVSGYPDRVQERLTRNDARVVVLQKPVPKAELLARIAHAMQAGTDPTDDV